MRYSQLLAVVSKSIFYRRWTRVKKIKRNGEYAKRNLPYSHYTPININHKKLDHFCFYFSLQAFAGSFCLAPGEATGFCPSMLFRCQVLYLCQPNLPQHLVTERSHQRLRKEQHHLKQHGHKPLRTLCHTCLKALNLLRELLSIILLHRAGHR